MELSSRACSLRLRVSSVWVKITPRSAADTTLMTKRFRAIFRNSRTA
jgi:hypothetical protein